jgi:hypothetical protein
MGTHMLKQYAQSFRLKSIYWYTLAVDLLTALIIGGLGFGILNKVSQQAIAVTGGRDSLALQNYVLSLTSEQAVLFQQQLKSLAINTIGAFIIIPLAGILLYSFSRSVLWHIISDTPFVFRKHWKWNLFTLVILILFSFWTFLMVIVRTVVTLPLSARTASGVSGVVLLLFASVFFVWLFLASHHSVQSRKVWKSVGHGFHTIKKQFKKVAAVWFFGFVTLFLLQAVQWPFAEWLFVHAQAGLVITWVLFILWLAWFRLYVTDTFK